MLNINKCNVTVMVTDLDNAIDFYTKTIDLTLKSRHGDHWADIEGPGIHIGLHPSDKDTQRSDNIQIGIGVPDLKAAVQDLQKKGVQFDFNDEEQIRIASFKDPDNNVLYLIQTSS
jgi:predicted enzyme related to lactoylglutathione lyase